VAEDPNFKVFFDRYKKLEISSLNQERLNSVPAEKNSGNIEYKLKLENPSIDRVDHLTTQMIFRLNEGFGKAIYRVGVQDSGVVEGIPEEEMKETL
jgi:GTPase